MKQQTNDEYDVIVVGAGLSGLTAALTVAERDTNLNLLILEASDKIGGRRYEDIKDSLAFVSDTNFFLKQLLHKLNIPVIRRTVSGYDVAELSPGVMESSVQEVPIFGGYLRKRKLEFFISKLELMTEQASFNSINLLESEELDNMTMEEFICENLSSNESRNFMRNIVETSCGVQAHNISTLFYLIYCNSTLGITNQYSQNSNGIAGHIIKGGAMRLCEAIKDLSGMEVATGEKVIAINRRNHFALVETHKQLFRCGYVIVAVPPKSVLQISFTPELTPTRMAVLRNMIYADYKTCLVTYDNNGWVDRHMSGDIFCGCAQNKNNVLKKCYEVSNFKPNSIYGILWQTDKARTLAQLERYFGRDYIFDPIAYSDRVLVDNICVPSPGYMKDFHEIRRPLNRIFWAGSETATDWYGHLEGDIQAGVRAGIELLYDYKPQTLTLKDIVSLIRKRKMVVSYKDCTVNRTLHPSGKLIIFALAGVVLTVFLLKRYLRSN